MEHPDIERINKTGYPYSERRQDCFVDGLNNEVYPDDEIFEYCGEFYLIEELSTDAIEILEQHGATRLIAK